MTDDEPPDSREMKSLTNRIKVLEQQLKCREKILEATQQIERAQLDLCDKLWGLAGKENVHSVDIRPKPTYGSCNEEEYFVEMRLTDNPFNAERVKSFLVRNGLPERSLRYVKNGEPVFIYRLHNIEVKFYQAKS